MQRQILPFLTAAAVLTAAVISYLANQSNAPRPDIAPQPKPAVVRQALIVGGTARDECGQTRLVPHQAHR